MKHAGKVVIGAVLVAGAGALFTACGSTASSGTDDAGSDSAVVTETSTVDTSVMDVTTSMDSATCDLSSDLTNNIPDAALDDSGTRSTGLCLGCVNTASTCKMQIDECNADCDCKSVVGDVLVCIAKGGSQIGCAAMAANISSNAQAIGYALLGSPQSTSSSGGSGPAATATFSKEAQEAHRAHHGHHGHHKAGGPPPGGAPPAGAPPGGAPPAGAPPSDGSEPATTSAT
jgi:hypothetical protein